VILLHPDDEPIVVAILPSVITLPVAGARRDVRLSAERYHHIIQRRLVDGDERVALVLQRMAAVVRAPSHVGRLTDHPLKVELFRQFSGDLVGVCVGLKCLNAGTWISTAFPVGSRTLVKYVRQGKLVPLAGHPSAREG